MSSNKKTILSLFLILITAVVAGSFILPRPGSLIFEKVSVPNLFFNNFLPWRLGLDLVGGSALIYDIDLSGFSPEEYGLVVSGLRDVIERRVNLYGVTEPKISVIQKGNHYRLMVELAGVRNLDEAVRQIGETPVLNFMADCRFSDTGFVCQPTALTGRHISRAVLSTDNLGRTVVSFELKDDGPKLFEEITEQNVGKPLCIFIDNDFIFPDNPAGSCPVVNEKIAGGRAQISGVGITPDVANELVKRFNAGALSAPIHLVNQRTVNATAASDSLGKIIIAGIIGTIAVMLFMIICYRRWGIIASLALLIYIIFTLALFKLIPYFTMSLAGIAGFVLSIGMAVDANILVFERTREEIKKGLPGILAFEEGFRRAWLSIRDSNLSTILTSIILYYLTSSFIRGFALTLMIGVIVSMFSAMVITKIIIRAFIKNK